VKILCVFASLRESFAKNWLLTDYVFSKTSREKSGTWQKQLAVIFFRHPATASCYCHLFPNAQGSANIDKTLSMLHHLAFSFTKLRATPAFGLPGRTAIPERDENIRQVLQSDNI
jgi:hypothetical protein